MSSSEVIPGAGLTTAGESVFFGSDAGALRVFGPNVPLLRYFEQQMLLEPGRQSRRLAFGGLD